MQKQITLISKDGVMYGVNLAINLIDGSVILDSAAKIAQMFGGHKVITEKTLSVKAESGSRKYLVSLIKAESGEYDVVIDDITSEKIRPLWQQIAGKSKLTQAVYDELMAVNDEFQTLYRAVSDEPQKTAVLTAMQNSMLRIAVKLSDQITKQNSKNGSVYKVQDFINAVIRNSASVIHAVTQIISEV